MSKRLARFFDEVLEFCWRTSPTMATSVGIHDHDHRLVDCDPEAIADRLRGLEAYRRDLAKLLASTPRVSADGRLDARVLGNFLEVEAHLLDEVRAPFRDPGSYLDEILYGVYYILERAFAPLPERAHRAALRLKEVPRLLHQAEANLADPREVPAPWVEAARGQTRGSLTFLADIGRDLAPRAGAAAAELGAALGEAMRAIDRFATFIGGRLRAEARGDFAAGRPLFEALLRAHHGIEMDADALHDFGAERVASMQERLAETARAIDSGRTWQELVAEWKNDYPKREEFLSGYVKEVKKAREFVRRKKLVSIPRGEHLHVVETPSFQRSICPLAAYLAPGPFEKKQDGFFWVTPPDDGAPPDAQRRHLQDHPRPGIPGTTVHEAYPGHHLQLSIANRIDSKVRRAVAAPVLIEGWAFYCEQLMAEQDYYDDDRTRVLQLKDELWRSCRVVIDVGLHTRGMTVDAAVAMLHDVARLETSSARGEVLRYTRTPTQPMSYAAGKHAILDLREAYRRRRGAAFRLQEFHDRFLSYGSIPVTMIRERMLGGSA